MHTKMKECKCCGNPSLKPILDLNKQPLANNLVDEHGKYDTYELLLNLCEECYHAQLSIAVDPQLLFSHYLYVSGTSQTLHREFDRVSKELCDLYKEINSAQSTLPRISVLDVASNDGTFLKYFKLLGCTILGIDPATNICDMATESGIKTINGFFGSPEGAELLGDKQFNIVTAFNVFAHIENPATFMASIFNVLTDNGICAIQTSQRDMFFNSQFDTIYHEHHHFYSILSFNEVCRRNGFFIYDVKFPEIHGGSYLFIIGKDKKLDRSKHFIEMERGHGRYNSNLYKVFSRDINEKREINLKKLDQLVSRGYKLVGFGAAAKGIVMLNYYNLKLDYVVDENPLKYNKTIPNVGAEIVSIEKAKELLSSGEKICFIILPWNFKKEISQKINYHFNQDIETICLIGN